MNQIQCLILTTAHHPDDARLNRHLDALSRRGIRAALVTEPPRSPWRRMMLAPWSVWRHLRETRPSTVLLPDPELYVAGALIARLLGVRAVIDIHEDYAAVAADRSWIPTSLRRTVSTVAKLVTALGRRIADATIVAADHLRRPGDLVVPNVPAPHFFPNPTRTGERPAAVYVGDITVSRGAHTMVDLLALVPELHLELIGSISDGLHDDLLDRTARKNNAARLHISGRLPYREAWERAAGATAGLSLLQDTPAYRSATPTKVWEYMAVGLPVVGTRLPAQMQLLEETGAGSVAGSIEEAADILRTWLADPDGAAEVGAKGRRAYESRIAGEGGAEALIEAVLG